MAATAPASRHSRAADVVEERMVTLRRYSDLSQVVGAAGVTVYSYKNGKQVKDIMYRRGQ